MSELAAFQKAYAPVIEAGYDGVEIFMMNVGNADCFLVIRHSCGGGTTTVLIDGGNKTNAPDIVERLQGLGISHINHVVNTHPHDDHAGGLVELIAGKAFTYDNLWVHQSWNHVDWQTIQTELGRNSAKWVLERLNTSLSTQVELCKASIARGITPIEPFAGAQIGPFIVLGPTRDFYAECLHRFGDAERVRQWNQYLQSRSEKSAFDQALEDALSDDDSLGAVTSPENESSVVMIAEYSGKKLLFCGDAGCDAFTDINDRRLAKYIKDVAWMHAPHHGSRRNMWQELVDYLNPRIAYISCKGSRKHPSRKLVNRLKTECQTNVYASYYPPSSDFTWIRSAFGTCPPRNLLTATPLYEAT